MKRRIGVIIMCTILATSPISALAADDYTGKVITMEKQEGETFFENATGRALEIRDSGKLYNGYQAYTEDGYIWIVLDENGVLRMDLDTKVKIEKTGNNLEVMLEEGEVFFNISESFAEDETFTISTSTMTTGIRGTAGAVSSNIQEEGTRIEKVQLYEGSVEIKTRGANDESQEIANQLHAGQEYSHESNSEGSNLENPQLRDLTADMVSGSVADEMRNSEELQNKILDVIDGMDEDTLNEIIGSADQKVADDKEARNKKQAEKEALIAESLASLEELAKVEISSDTGSSSSSSTSTDESVDDSTTSSDTSTSAVAITVSFYYYSEDGTTLKLFSTQDGTSDVVPTKPVIQPAASGDWTLSDGTVYDFSTLLTADTTLTWVTTVE
ncbi:MAG: FecR domain-containing protein [Eubacteriales bacterium]